MTSAVVVGSGSNGLAATVALAQAGIDVTVLEAHNEIGGSTRSSELTLPGLLHDECSATHPTGAASPFFRSFHLGRHGLEWLWPEVDAAHPIDGGRAGVMFKDLDRTAEGLGVDGAAWKRLYELLAANIDDLIGELFRPIMHTPSHPLKLPEADIVMYDTSPAPAGRSATSTRSGPTRMSHTATPAMRPNTSSGRSNASRQVSGTASSRPRSGRRPSSRRPTPTTSAATSPAAPASICVRPRRLRAGEFTVWAAPMRPPRRCGSSDRALR